MIASVRGLAILGAIAVVLAVVLVASGPPAHGPVDRTLVPGLDVATVDGIEVQRAGDRLVVLRRENAHWFWKDPPSGAEQMTVEALLAAVRGAHWHREGARSVLGPVRATVRLHAGTKVTEIVVGADLAGAEQTWLGVGGRALLVDRWVATALSPEAVALRLQQPLAGVGSARTIVVGGLRLDGTHRTSPTAVWVDPARVATLVHAIASLEIVGLSDAAPGSPEEHVFFDGATPNDVARAGTCANARVLVNAKTGAGCVERARWQEIVDAARALDGEPQTVADPRPMPLPAVLLTFGDGPTLDLTGEPHLGADDADPAKASELVAALTSPAEVVAHPPGKPRSTIRAQQSTIAEVTLELYDGVIARAGEPFALRPSREAWAVITRPVASLRDPVLWREESTTITSITVDGATYVRGAVLGEWNRERGGAAGSAAPPVDAALVDALASELAIVRAPSITAAEVARDPLTLDVAVIFTPPAGAPATHRLAIGALASDGCAARADGATVRLDPALCTAAHALAP